MIEIRKIKQADNIALSTMIRNVFEEHKAPKKGTVYSDPTTDNLYDLFKTKKSILWVAVVDKKVVGCCGIYPTHGLPENYAELVKLYLAKESRDKGIGKMLLNKSIQSAKSFEYSNLYIESLPEFSTAVSIYKKQGFLKLEKPLGKSVHTACNIWMLKKL